MDLETFREKIHEEEILESPFIVFDQILQNASPINENMDNMNQFNNYMDDDSFFNENFPQSNQQSDENNSEVSEDNQFDDNQNIPQITAVNTTNDCSNIIISWDDDNLNMGLCQDNNADKFLGLVVFMI